MASSERALRSRKVSPPRETRSMTVRLGNVSSPRRSALTSYDVTVRRSNRARATSRSRLGTRTRYVGPLGWAHGGPAAATRHSGMRLRRVAAALAALGLLAGCGSTGHPDAVG